MVRVCGRPINIVPESLSFDIDTNHWISFPNKKALFPWRGTIPEGWKFKPIPNQNSPKFVCVSGLLAGISTEGTSKRFQVDIMLVTFLGSAPPAHATQSEYSALQSTTPTDFSRSTGEGGAHSATFPHGSWGMQRDRIPWTMGHAMLYNALYNP